MMMTILTLIYITSIDGQILEEDVIAIYEINNNIEYCEKYVKPAFEQTRQTPPYVIEVKAECTKQ